MSEFSGYFLHGYSSALAMAAFNIDVRRFSTEVIVLSKDFSDHHNYDTKELDGKRILVISENSPRPFEITFPVTNSDGEELTFANCKLKLLQKARVSGIEAFLNSSRQQISFRAKAIEGVK